MFVLNQPSGPQCEPVARLQDGLLLNPDEAALHRELSTAEQPVPIGTGPLIALIQVIAKIFDQTAGEFTSGQLQSVR